MIPVATRENPDTAVVAATEVVTYVVREGDTRWDSQVVPGPGVMRVAVGGIRAATPPSMLGSIRQTQ